MTNYTQQCIYLVEVLLNWTTKAVLVIVALNVWQYGAALAYLGYALRKKGNMIAGPLLAVWDGITTNRTTDNFDQMNLTGPDKPMPRVLNKKYWPYQYRMLPKEDPWGQKVELERFCYASFKSGNWRNDGLYFSFKREQDATYFLLRWGG